MCTCGGGAYVHMYTKCEVSMSNPVAGGVCTDDNANANMATDANNGQFTVV